MRGATGAAPGPPNELAPTVIEPRAEDLIMISEAARDDGKTALEQPRDALARIDAALRGLRYGTVTAVVQDGVVVQVERTEKFRLERRQRSS